MPKLKLISGQTAATALQHALDAVEIAGTWDRDIVSDQVRADIFVALLFNVDPDQAAAGVPLSAYIGGIHPDDQEHAHALIRRSIDEDIPFVAECRVLSADGLTRWVLDRGYTIHDTAGRPVRGRGIIVDMTRSRTDTRTCANGAGIPPGNLLEHAAQHVPAAQQAIARLQDADLKARADALLLELGRKLAQEEVRYRRTHMN